MGYVMRKITVHIDDKDLAAFQAEARAGNTGPEDIIARKIKQSADLIRQVTRITSGIIEAQEKIQADLLNLNMLTDHAMMLDKVKNEVATMERMLNLGAAWTFTDATAPVQTATSDTLKERRAKRFAILQGDGPLWTGEPGKPKDGLVYEQELRAEW